MDEGQLLRQFIAESEDLVEALQEDLEALATQQASGRINPELLNRIFRSAHSIKGMAGMAAVGSIERAAHRLEDLLDDLRMGRLRPDAALVAGCARAAGELAEMIGAVAHGRAPETEADRLAAAVDALRTGAAAAAEDDDAAFVDLDERVRKTLTEYEEHRLRDNLRERRPLYDVRVAFDFAAFDAGFRAVSDALAAAGEVISKLPGVGDDPMKIAFRILYATDAPASDVEQIVASANGTVTLISRYPEPVVAPEAGTRREAGEPVATWVRVEMRTLDDLAVLAEGLALRTAAIAATCASMAERLGLGAREQFELKQQARSLERGFVELEERLVDARLVPLAPTFARARRRVLKIASELGRDVEFIAEGDDVRIDKAIADRVAEPLTHLLHNAVDHGVEPPEAREAAGKPARARITLRAEQRGNRVAVSVSDDGRGIDAEALARAAEALGLAGTGIDAIFQPGVSTAGAVSTVSGRGVGLDAVASAVAGLGGEVEVVTEQGQGTSFTITLPTTLVTVSAFLVDAGSATYAIDVNQLAELGLVEPGGVALIREGASIVWRDATLPFFQLASLVHADGGVWEPAGKLSCLIARFGDRLAAVAVDRFVGERELVVKSLGRHAAALRGVSGAVDLEGGRVALLIDLAWLIGERRRAAGART